jgi:divalent metal cation (Fe/Co/Zn/Cd) transporter
MLGLVLAAVGIGLTASTGDPIWDVIFSASIAVLLGLIAFYLGYVNIRYLLDVRDLEAEAAFRAVIAEHNEVERFHDLRSIVVDEKSTVLVAEIELREEAIVPGLIQNIRLRRDSVLETLPQARREQEGVRDYVSSRAAVEATLTRTEEIVDELEAEIRRRAPQVCHITIEVQGIAAVVETTPEVSTA